MPARTKVILTLLISGILIAHVFMWRSDMDSTAKLVFTVINFTGWAIVLGPIVLVHRWMKAVEARNAEERERT